ncbi:hypothetical protein VTN00DRAFT_3372 [Thermoascus crustaceus]|uniref:uncharacterized protein n=1 Tax=Thermoascus crustaceus TaxID=5088 RepID=UPI003742F79A
MTAAAARLRRERASDRKVPTSPRRAARPAPPVAPKHLVHFLLLSLLRTADESSLPPRRLFASPVPLLVQRLPGSVLATLVHALTSSHLAKSEFETPALEATPELVSPHKTTLARVPDDLRPSFITARSTA